MKDYETLEYLGRVMLSPDDPDACTCSDDDNDNNRYIKFEHKGEIHMIPFYMLEDMASEREAILEKYPVKSGDKRIAFMVDHFFIGNTSGIFTFIKHFAQMCRDMGYNLDIITEVSAHDRLPETFDMSNVSLFFMPDYVQNLNGRMYFTPEHEDEVRAPTMQLSMEGYLQEFTPELVVAHSYSATKAMDNLQPILDGMDAKYMTYTHIGDVMDSNNVEMIDFKDDLVREYITLLESIDFPIGTQTPGVRQQLLNLLGDKEIHVLPEPFFEPQTVYRTKDGKKGVLMIGSNYKRKNFQKMFDILAITGLPCTVVCGVDIDKETGESLEEMAQKAGVQGVRIIKDLPNEYMHYIINGSKVMLHLSEIEVLPYAILESAPHIPCIINGEAPWAKDFPIPHIPVNPDDIFECVMKISEAYGDKFEYPVLDLDVYKTDCEAEWKTVLKDHGV